MMQEKCDPAEEHFREPGSWSEEKERMYYDAIEGLEDGDLSPLLAYIEKGYVIEWQLAWTIGRAISGDNPNLPFLLKLVGKNKSSRKLSETRALHLQKLDLGAEVRKRLQSNPMLKVEDAVKDVAKAQNPRVGVTKCFEGYALVKRQMESDEFVHDWGVLIQLLPDEWDIASDGTVTRRRK